MNIVSNWLNEMTGDGTLVTFYKIDPGSKFTFDRMLKITAALFPPQLRLLLQSPTNGRSPTSGHMHLV